MIHVTYFISPIMPFLFIGLILLVIGFLLRRAAHHGHDHGGLVGAEHLMIAGVILILLYGLVFRSLTLFYSA